MLTVLIAGCGTTAAPHVRHANPPTPIAKAPATPGESTTTASQQFITDTAEFGAKSSNLTQVMGGWQATTSLTTIRTQIAPISEAFALYVEQLASLAKIAPAPLAGDFAACATKEEVVSRTLNQFITDSTYAQVQATINAVLHAMAAASLTMSHAAMATGLEKG